MNNRKTTIAGIILAVIVAIQPVIEGTGYHFDTPTIVRIVFAASLAALGYLSKDHNA